MSHGRKEGRRTKEGRSKGKGWAPFGEEGEVPSVLGHGGTAAPHGLGTQRGCLCLSPVNALHPAQCRGSTASQSDVGQLLGPRPPLVSSGTSMQ